MDLKTVAVTDNSYGHRLKYRDSTSRSGVIVIGTYRRLLSVKTGKKSQTHITEGHK